MPIGTADGAAFDAANHTMEIEAFIFVVLVVAAAIVAVVAVGTRSGRPQRTCPSCGAPHPAVARFCCRCGKNL